MYIYGSHLGGIYTSDEEIPFEDLYCEECGDSDTELGEADTIAEAWQVLKPQTAISEECGGYEPAYILPILASFVDEDTKIPDLKVNDYGISRLPDKKIKKLIIKLTGDTRAMTPDHERLLPSCIYKGMPSSVMAVGCALNLFDKKAIEKKLLPGSEVWEYPSLTQLDKLIRKHLSVTNKTGAVKGKDVTLLEYMDKHNTPAIICCMESIIYYNGMDYYSFLDVSCNNIIAVWELDKAE